jgi:tetratricopeptide (TPR) repeat protein
VLKAEAEGWSGLKAARRAACCDDRREKRMEDRINYFERMLADNPDNPTGLLALANEYQKAGRYEDEAAVLGRYVSVHEDEGNAYARLGEVLGRLGREDEARAAYEAGIRQAEKYGHSGMAEDLRVALIQLRE